MDIEPIQVAAGWTRIEEVAHEANEVGLKPVLGSLTVGGTVGSALGTLGAASADAAALGATLGTGIGTLVGAVFGVVWAVILGRRERRIQRKLPSPRGDEEEGE